MSLADALAQAGPRRKGPPCTMGKLLDGLPDADREALVASLDGDMQSSVIAQVLRDHGHDVGDHVVRYHRAGKCQCGKGE